MTSRILTLAALAAAFAFAPTRADAAGSCSGFVTIEKYDAAKNIATVDYTRGSESQFFPKPEGSPNTSKIPAPCKGKVKKETNLVVTPTGGRMTVTQIRANFSGKMLNDTRDASWVPTQIQKLVEDKTVVVITVREGLGKDAPLGITTIYLPISDEEKAEIARLEAQAEDVE